MSGIATSMLFDLYGLAFFVMGVSVLLSAEYRSDLFYTRHIGWLAAFGVLYGIAGFIAGQAYLRNDPGLSLPILILRTGALAFLLEYGRRLWNHGERANIHFWLPQLAAVTLMAVGVIVTNETHAGLDATERYFVFLPLSWTIAWILAQDTRSSATNLRTLGVLPWLLTLRLSYILFGVFSLVLVLPLQVAPWLPTNNVFRQWAGFRVQLIHTVIACTIAVCHFMLARLTVRLAFKRNLENLEVIRARTEEMLLAKTNAEKANTAKSEFLSRMSHELRTPLNAIMGFSQLLQLQQQQSQAREYVDHIVTAGKHLLTLVNDLLDFSRIETGNLQLRMEPVALIPLMEEAIQQVMHVAEYRKISFERHYTHDGVVLADKTRLLQVLINLLSNAAKYNHDGGRIIVHTEPTAGNRTRISITDTGSGIAMGDLGRLFKPFERLQSHESAIEGTGIGLALSKHLMEAMQGTIGVTSTLGSGSTFWIELPQGDANHVGEPSAFAIGSPPEPDPQRTMTLLLVEDNLVNVLLLEHYFASIKGYRLLAATDALQGLEMAVTLQPDLVLMDINLPGEMDGYDVLRALRQRPQTRHIPAIAISANALPDDVARGKAAGFADYLIKPLNLAELLATLKRFTPPR